MAGEVTVRDYLETARFVRDSLAFQTQIIITANKQAILDLNRERQLYDKGIDNEGNLLKPYTPFTKALKKFHGDVFNRTTLLDEGDFYKGFDLLFRNGNISIFSRDSKSADLVDKYGNIFGLTEENQVIFNEEILNPELLNYITQYL